ncbi:hypothetical protein [Scytonema sp. HK-05]
MATTEVKSAGTEHRMQVRPSGVEGTVKPPGIGRPQEPLVVNALTKQ